MFSDNLITRDISKETNNTELVCKVDTNININKSLSLNDNEDYLSDYTIQGDLIIKKKYNKRISEIKCEEYKTMIQSLNITSKQCINCPMFLISHGQIVEANEFPHMAAIGWIHRLSNDSIKYLCAGSLISDQWVLTSAHCTHNRIGKPAVVKLGSIHLMENSGVIIKIIYIIKHSKFKSPQLYHDIALLKLERQVTFKSNIQPACLYNKFETTPAVVWATGWGSDQNDDYNPRNELMKAKLHVIDNLNCSFAYNFTAVTPNGITPNMLCAGDLFNDWKSDTCTGDSGSPIQFYHDRGSCLFDIVGITSFGKLCAVKNIPGVYTRVSHYIGWIEQIVW
ncbi:serine protease snake-like [Microplitis mediator]|uniref:serine protease snake-like n=1 Tax=Microplitis mediator TaxID=375433 RepID=UPI0025544E42|nr:serine protease snake-like [Microplitis mediator]